MARRSWLALLPASKGTAPHGDGPPWSRVAAPDAAIVTAAVTGSADLDDDALARLTECRPGQVQEVRALLHGLASAPTLPAWRRYTGVVHTTADPAGLHADDRRRYRRHIAYVSALGGLVAADEPLPPYRLPMAATLADTGGLAGWWRPRITRRLHDLLTPGGRIWLLTGGEYGRAIAAPTGTHLLEPTFVERRAGKERTPPAAALKQARGHLARTLATQPRLARQPDAEAWRRVTFVAGGRTFHLDEATSDSQRWRASQA